MKLGLLYKSNNIQFISQRHNGHTLDLFNQSFRQHR
jgi:hypothetical protein